MRVRGPRYLRNMNLKANYGITIEEYEELVKKQNGVCAACFSPEIHKANHTDVITLAVDHDHDSGKTRGLLCMKCNRALGLLDDSADVIEALLEYRKKFKN